MRGGAEIFMKLINSFQEVCIILNVKGFDKNIFFVFQGFSLICSVYQDGTQRKR